MVEISKVDFKDLQYFHRLDSDFYKPSFLKIYDKLKEVRKKYDVVPLTEIIVCPVRTGATPKEREPLNDGTDVLFIKTDSVRKGFINYSVADLLPLESHKKRKLTSLRYGDIVVTVVGATQEIVGRAGLYLKKESANINQSDALIRINENKIEAGFLSTFINSKYGRFQLWRYSGQTGQVTLNCREVEQMIIPIFPKEFRNKIHQQVLESERLRELAKDSYKKAEELIMNELNIDNNDLKKDLTFCSELIEIKENKRLDAEFFMPKYKRILSHIQKYGKSTIKEEFKPIKTRFKRNKEEKYNYIEIGDVSLDIGDSDPTEMNGDELPDNAKIKLNGGEVLVSKVRPTRGAVSIIQNLEIKNLVCSGAFTVLKEAGKIKKEVLSVFLRSEIGKNLLGRGVTGTSYPRIEDEIVLGMEIPIFKENIQDKIMKLIFTSYNSKKEAKELLEKSKLQVENKIEQN